MGNGQCEHFNHTLISMLGTLPPDGKSDWVDKVNTLVLAYNSTHSVATGFSPYYLLFGQHPHLPMDVTFNLPNSEMMPQLHSHNVQKLQSRLKWAYEMKRPKK